MANWKVILTSGDYYDIPGDLEAKFAADWLLFIEKKQVCAAFPTSAVKSVVTVPVKEAPRG
jgi:hypothetical protein